MDFDFTSNTSSSKLASVADANGPTSSYRTGTSAAKPLGASSSGKSTIHSHTAHPASVHTPLLLTVMFLAVAGATTFALGSVYNSNRPKQALEQFYAAGETCSQPSGTYLGSGGCECNWSLNKGVKWHYKCVNGKVERYNQLDSSCDSSCSGGGGGGGGSGGSAGAACSDSAPCSGSLVCDFGTCRSCSDLTSAGESRCWTHTKCAWINGSCQVNTLPPGSNVRISGNCDSFTVTGGCAQLAVARCSKPASSESWCRDPNNQFVGCSTGTQTFCAGTHSISAPGNQCAVWQIDASGHGFSCSKKGCNWDGASCNLKPTPTSTPIALGLPQHKTISGRVTCTRNGQVLPVGNARVRSYRHYADEYGQPGDDLKPIHLTDANGTYSFSFENVQGQDSYDIAVLKEEGNTMTPAITVPVENVNASKGYIGAITVLGSVLNGAVCNSASPYSQGNTTMTPSYSGNYAYCSLTQDNVTGFDFNLGECGLPPTPTPTPVPTATPVPMACLGLATSKTSPQRGDTVVYTCTGEGTYAKYANFRLLRNGTVVSSSASPILLDANKRASWNVTLTQDMAGGTYTAQCQVCSNPFTSLNPCTPWNQAQ